MFRFLAISTALAVVILSTVHARQQDKQPAKQPDPPTADQLKFFESKIRPVLIDSCISCHGPEKQKGDLRLDSQTDLLKGGERGPAVVPGHPEKSLLIKAITHEDATFKMPRSAEKLSKEHIADLTRWVKMGAPWPAGDKIVASKKGEMQVTDKDRQFWAFKPVVKPSVPKVKNTAWVRNPIDSFILAKLEEKGLTPSPPAAKHELVRRLYFDLTGLPPTPKEVADFVNDPSPKAWDNLIDKLLDSPGYGEKWARHWLDLVRYAETTVTNATAPNRMSGVIAITSFALSIRTNRLTSSCVNSLPATNCPIPAWMR
ncbi:MAG TPA: DUF1549 domain-containing protein [Gemmataceae bacterium]|nr:DUF1549 domain-containing protein [Gemmataceae bacterium]